MTITAFAALCLVKFFYNDKVCLFVTCNNHLGYALSVVNHEVVLRKIDQQDTYLTTIVGINGAGRV